MRTHLHCPTCNRDYPLTTELTYLCAQCQGNLQVHYDYDAIAKIWDRDALSTNQDLTIWRYLPMLPVEEGIDVPPLGWTPCFQAPRLAAHCGVDTLWLKNDSVTPSASFKDRASAVALKWAKEHGHQIITAASTGNAGAAAALWSTALGLTANIFLPHTAPPAKVAQLQVFGANAILVDGNYDQAFELCLQATERFGWYNRNTGFNPITREGKKSVSFEICEQLGWQVPDVVVVSVGDGNIISGVWKGFAELKRIGWIDKTPRLLAVQAEGSDAIVTALEQDKAIEAIHADTIADSISVDLPRDGDYAVRAIRESGGWGIRVSDQAILNAIPTLARQAGTFVEPAAATSLAGLEAAMAKGLFGKESSALLLLTGHGLKDIGAVQRLLPKPPTQPLHLDALAQEFGD